MPTRSDACVPAHDVLCAGFPCQPFSKSGFQHGVRDQTRGTLFFDIMSIVLARQPEYVILENVRNLAGPRHAGTWATIVESLREAGYRVAQAPVVLSPHLLSPADGGAPQVRDRVFVLAHRLRAGTPEEMRIGPTLVHRQPSEGWDPDRWDIREVLEHPAPPLEVYGIRPQEQTWLDAWQAFVQAIPDDVLPGFPIWVDAFESRPRLSSATPAWKADFLTKNSAFYRRHRRLIDRWRRQRFGPLRLTVDELPPSRRKLRVAGPQGAAGSIGPRPGGPRRPPPAVGHQGEATDLPPRPRGHHPDQPAGTEGDRLRLAAPHPSRGSTAAGRPLRGLRPRRRARPDDLPAARATR